MPNIHDWGQKIKLLLEEGIGEWGLILLVFLVGFASFGLGRLSAHERSNPPVSIVESAEASKSQALYAGGEFVASKTGTVYYYPWCTAAEKIASEEQVWFATETSAQKAGYRPAKNCKGLMNSN